MRFAVIDGEGMNAMVENIIVMDEGQREEMERALGKKLMDAGPLGMEIGDMYNGTHWTRNVGGEQAALPIDTANPDVDAILLILEGMVE